MRKRYEIEGDGAKKDGLLLEVLLDIRDGQAAILKALEQPVEPKKKSPKKKAPKKRVPKAAPKET